MLELNHPSFWTELASKKVLHALLSLRGRQCQPIFHYARLYGSCAKSALCSRVTSSSQICIFYLCDSSQTYRISRTGSVRACSHGWTIRAFCGTASTRCLYQRVGRTYTCVWPSSITIWKQLDRFQPTYASTSQPYACTRDASTAANYRRTRVFSFPVHFSLRQIC